MRQCVFSNGGKSRATRTPFALHPSRNALAGRPLRDEMALLIFAALGAVVYGGCILAMFGTEWLRMLRRRGQR